MRFLVRLADRLAQAELALAGCILVYAVGHILLETVLRSLFATSTYVLDEFIGFAVLSITFLSLAWTLRCGAAIRVSLVTELLPAAARRWVETAVALVGFATIAGLCAIFWRNLAKDWMRGAVSESVAEVPLWIPDLIVLAGASLLALQLLVRAGVHAAGVADDAAVTDDGLPGGS